MRLRRSPDVPGPRLLAWGLGVACVCGAGVGIWLSAADAASAPWKSLILPVVLSLPGTLIAASRPRALLGWLLLAVAVCFTTSALAQVWIRHGDASDALVTAFAAWYALCVAAMAVRVRRARGADRSRLVVLFLALAVLVAAIVAGHALGEPASEIVEILASLLFGLVLVSAVLRRQLEGVTVVVHHAFVLTTLGALVVGVYVLTVGALAATGPDLSRFGAGVVAACAALVVQPLRVRLQRWVDRLMQGDRRDPFQAVTRLAEGTHRAPSLEGVLSAVASSLATSLRVPRVRVDAFGVSAGHPPRVGTAGDTGPEHRVPLVAGDREIGSAVLVLQPGRRLRPDERRLLAELGRHAGLAVDSARLATEVAAHHREVVAAREEERRRLGRELHDDLGPTVAGLSMQLGALRPLVHRDPDTVVARLARLEEAASGALGDIRRLAHQLHPPVLDQVGLARAVRQVADSLDLAVAAEVVEHGARAGEGGGTVVTAVLPLSRPVAPVVEQPVGPEGER